MIVVAEALAKILNAAVPLGSHKIPIEKSLSHVLAEDVLADRPIPPFDRVAMDGFAVNSADFRTASVELKIVDRIQTGVASSRVLNPGEAIQIMTGAPSPQGADAVVKVENAKVDGDWVTLVEEKMKPGLNIAKQGEDAAEGKLLIPAGTPLTTAGIAVCASVGISKVEVGRKPRIRIISTGTEIVPPHQEPLPHQIRDCNSFTLRTLCRALDLEAEFLGISVDDTKILGKLIREGLKADILVLSGGVSMGDYDHVPALLSENGVEKIFHSVEIKPGKPVWFGKTGNNTYVFGLPGNPVSVQTAFKIFAEPLIRKLSGETSPQPRFLYLPLLNDVSSSTPREHYMPGRMSNQEGKTFVEHVSIRGSGDFSNFESSQGLIRCPAEMNLLKANSMVEFLPWGEVW